MIVLLCVAYFAVLLVLSAYGLHRLHLVILCRRHRDKIQSVAKLAGPPVADDELPMVTIQLPIFNESTVIQRLLESVALMDYPKDRLHIQVLDDSIDETQVLARAEVDKLRDRGFDAEYIHRGLKTAKGELVAIFDADFVPSPDFARALVGHFQNPKVGMVQARWAHLNRDASMLTRIQALMLDGHHLVENRARYGAGFFFNFSGTGGMWRREAIADAGGWQHDTITEDLDLSYRAQLRGWKFIYRVDVVSPAELPEDIGALRAQQYRWAKGTVQTARKLLRRVCSANLSLSQRIEAVFHLTPHFAYPLMVMLSLLLLPVLLTVDAISDVRMALLFDLPLCMAPISSLAAFYMLAETAQGRSRWGALKLLPWLIALGAGLSPHLTTGVRDGWRLKAGEFVRTPKRGDNRWRYAIGSELPIVEMVMACVSAASFVASIHSGHYFATPFAFLFTLGYAYIAYLLIAESVARRRVAPPVVEAEAPAPAAVKAAQADGAVVTELAA